MSDWKPGDVALLPNGQRAVVTKRGNLVYGEESFAKPQSINGKGARRLLVIDPEDRESVERLAGGEGRVNVWWLQERLREYANPTPKLAEPTDPAARVTDRRENIWRLLADGDWVCTSGPDVGEYIKWDRLAAERGPLSVEVIP